MNGLSFARHLAASIILPMVKHGVHDEVLMQQAGNSAARVLRHLLCHVPGGRVGSAMLATDAATPVAPVDTAIKSLRILIGILHKEGGSR